MTDILSKEKQNKNCVYGKVKQKDKPQLLDSNTGPAE